MSLSKIEITLKCDTSRLDAALASLAATAVPMDEIEQKVDMLGLYWHCFDGAMGTHALIRLLPTSFTIAEGFSGNSDISAAKWEAYYNLCRIVPGLARLKLGENDALSD